MSDCCNDGFREPYDAAPIGANVTFTGVTMLGVPVMFVGKIQPGCEITRIGFSDEIGPIVETVNGCGERETVPLEMRVADSPSASA